jgi:alkaline phosphatase
MPMPVRTIIILAAIALALLLGCRVQPTPEALPSSPQEGHAKNVILMIGDGMGLAHITAAMYANNNRLTMEHFPVVGLHKPPSADNLITDSAAGATAFACGIKTYNGAVGLTADSLPCYTILEEARDRGYATGLVATSTIVHATPAAFAAHQPLRGMYEDIALDFAQAEVDLLIGGGKRYFDRRDRDNRDLYAELQKKGYQVSDYLSGELTSITSNGRRKFAYFTADKHPLTYDAGRDYLPYAVKFSCAFLSRRQAEGFFLMVEGSQIDWGGHSNDGGMVVSETLDFDRAVAAALEFARKNRETLVIVTADHEAGGMALNPGSKMNRINAAFTTNGHTGTLIPVFAYGPGAELFGGIYENTAIYHKMRQALRFTPDTAALKH